MQKIINEVTKIYSRNPKIVGITLCGSFNKSSNDRISDVDIFIYVRRKNLNKAFIRNNFFVENSQVCKKNLNIEQNFYHQSYNFNIKFFTINFLDAYSKKQILFNDFTLEQIENIITMKVLFERKKIISRYKKSLLKKVNSNKKIISKALIDRYGNIIWRSAYQGIFRNEKISCFLMLIKAVDLLIKLFYLGNNVVPFPIKWRYSAKSLNKLKNNPPVKILLKRLAKLNCANKNELMSYYKLLKQVEISILTPFNINNFWWWEVFSPARLKIVGTDPIFQKQLLSLYIKN